jgi:very-short-patch-repair endonuclease
MVAREMDQAPTSAEETLWLRLRNRQIDGTKFRRQQPIERFVVDFYCTDARLAIEVDGPIHDDQSGQDAARQEMLESLELRVIRFRNDEILTNMTGVIERIRSESNE